MSEELQYMHEQIEKIHKCSVDQVNADVLHRYIDEQQSRIDQLAAQVERLREALIYSTDYLDQNPLNSIGHKSKAHMEMRNAINETPAQALAEIEAERNQLRSELDECVRAWALTKAELAQERERVKRRSAALGIAYHHMLPCGLTEEESLKIDAALSDDEPRTTNKSGGGDD